MANTKSDSELNIDDLHKVYEFVIDARSKWHNLGLRLGLNNNTLNSIQRRWNNEDEDCLRDMLSKVLESKSITWYGIQEALKSPTVGMNQLAEKVRTRKQTKKSQRKARYKISSASSSTELSETTESEDEQSFESPKRKKKKSDLDAIQSKYEELKQKTVKSLNEKGIRGQDVYNFLTGRAKTGHKCKRSEESKYLFGVTVVRKSYDDGLCFTDPLMSFFNYQILKEIIEEFGDLSDKADIESYSEEFEQFLKIWKVQSLEISKCVMFQKEFKLKIDAVSLEKYTIIKKSVARIFKVSIADIYLLKIELACDTIELIFALANKAFVPFSEQQHSADAQWRELPIVLKVTCSSLSNSVIYDKSIASSISSMLLKECRSKTPDIEKVKGYLETNRDIVDVRDDDEFKWTPLMWACQNEYFDIAKLLLKYKPQVNIQDKKEWSPLILASRAGDLEIVKGIVELGADIHKPTNKKWTPLMWAAHKGHVEVARFLLEKKAIVDSPDVNGWTPLMQASQEGHVNIVDLLLEYKANINLKTKTSWCALMAAAKNKNSEVVEALLKKGANVDTLLKKQANVDIEREDGTTALQVACFIDNNSAVINALIKHGANVDHIDKNGITALMLAACKAPDSNCEEDSGRLDTVQALLTSESIDINKQHSGTGWTALSFAAHAGYPNVFDKLLRRAAAMDIEIDMEEITEIAHNSGHEKTLRKLTKFKDEELRESKKMFKQLQHRLESLEFRQEMIKTMLEQKCKGVDSSIDSPRHSWANYN